MNFVKLKKRAQGKIIDKPFTDKEMNVALSLQNNIYGFSLEKQKQILQDTIAETSSERNVCTTYIQYTKNVCSKMFKDPTSYET